MRGCALRKVVRDLAHKKLENRGVEPQHLPSQILLLFYLVCEERCTGIGGQATEGHNDGSCAALSDRTPTAPTEKVRAPLHPSHAISGCWISWESARTVGDISDN